MNFFSNSRTLKKLFKIFAVFLIFLILLYLFRIPILKSVGSYLVYEDEITEVEALFVLSGNPYERPNYAAGLYHSGITPKIVCTGIIIPYNIRALNLEEHEGNLSRSQLMKNGVSEEDIVLIEEGKSTWEEANVIRDYCLENGITEIGILSSSFHTRRVSQTFRRVLKNTGINFYVFPAPVDGFDPHGWWKNENGVISVNNEYIKIIYYRLRY